MFHTQPAAEYLLSFQPMALFHKQNKIVYFQPGGKQSSREQPGEPSDAKPPDGKEGEHGEAYSDLLAKVPTIEPFQTTHAAGELEPVGFPADDNEGKLFYLTSSPTGQCRVILDIPVHGGPAAWAHYQIGVTIDGKPQKLCPKVGSTGRLTVDCGELRDASKADTSIDVQLDTTLYAQSDLPEDFPLPKPFKARYSCQSEIVLGEPRIVGDDFVFTAHCHAVATPGPPATPGTEPTPWINRAHRAAQLFQLSFEADKELPDQDKLASKVRYTYRPDGKDAHVGYCDGYGVFSARLDVTAARRVTRRDVWLVAASLDNKPFKGAGSLPQGQASRHQQLPQRPEPAVEEMP